MNGVMVAAFLLLGLMWGFVMHEVAHWVVLRLAGLDDGLSLWPPRASFSLDGRVTPPMRLAAVAPALLGLVVVAIAFASASLLSVAFAAGAGGRLFALSPADRAVFRGRHPDASG